VVVVHCGFFGSDCFIRGEWFMFGCSRFWRYTQSFRLDDVQQSAGVGATYAGTELESREQLLEFSKYLATQA
jgi:hypothetical protein